LVFKTQERKKERKKVLSRDWKLNWTLTKQYHHTYVHMHNILKTNLPILYSVLTLCPCQENRQGHTDATFLFSFFQFSLEWQCPQLLSKEETFPVGKGGGQQMWHSNATSKSAVPGTRLLVTSCPAVNSCWWRDTSPASLTCECR